MNAANSLSQSQAAPAPATSPSPQSQPVRWAIDASHSHVSFGVRHLMISTVRGEFGKLSGEVTYDPARPEETTINVTIDVASISTRDEKRDAHLRSPDFFDVEQFPAITFVARSVQAGQRAANDGDSRGLQVVGDLTIHGTTRTVTLAVDEVTPESGDPWGNRRVGASARTKIRRSDFGMRWNAALETGGVLVGDEITINLEVELVRQK
jgi:polyisoprenoid-binding protein YceI